MSLHELRAALTLLAIALMMRVVGHRPPDGTADHLASFIFDQPQ